MAQNKKELARRVGEPSPADRERRTLRDEQPPALDEADERALDEAHRAVRAGVDDQVGGTVITSDTYGETS